MFVSRIIYIILYNIWGVILDLFRVVLCGGEPVQKASDLHGTNYRILQREETP